MILIAQYGNGNDYSTCTVPLQTMNRTQYSAWRSAADLYGYDSLEAAQNNTSGDSSWAPLMLLGDTFQVVPVDSMIFALSAY